MLHLQWCEWFHGFSEIILKPFLARVEKFFSLFLVCNVGKSALVLNYPGATDIAVVGT